MWAEQGRWYVEGQQQHILLTAMNSLFYSLCSIVFPVHKAVVSLSILCCIAGALGVAYFFATLKLLFQNRALALFGALGLAFSLNYWQYSTLTETHILPTFFLILAVYFLARFQTKNSARTVVYSGIAMSLSLFASEANSVFIPALLVFLVFSAPQDKGRNTLLFLITIVLTWAVPFFILGILLRPAPSTMGIASGDLLTSASYFLSWFKGSLYSIPFAPENIFVIITKFPRAVFANAGNPVATVLFYAAIWLLLFYNRRDLIKNNLSILLSFIAATGFFAGTILFYEPYNLQRYTPLLIFLWLLICRLMMKPFFTGMSFYKKLAFGFGIFILMANNFTASIFPRSKTENNFQLEQALLIDTVTQKGDIVIINGSGAMYLPPLELRYIPYFTKCGVLSIHESIEKETAATHMEILLKSFKNTIDSTLEENRKVLILDNVLTLNDRPYPAIYSEVRDFITTNHRVIPLAKKGAVTIYQIQK